MDFREQDKHRVQIAITKAIYTPTIYFAKWETHLARMRKGSRISTTFWKMATVR